MSAKDILFGKKKNPREMMREYKRGIERTVRDLDREREKLQMQEKKLIADMKRLAKQNQIDAVKIMAKDLVRTRKYVAKFYKMKAQLQAVSLQLQTVSSTQAMVEAMKGTTKAMMVMNRQMNLPAMQGIMQEFMKQNEIMEMKEEVMNDTIDQVMEDDTDANEENALVSQVLDEIGLNLKGQLGETPANKVAVEPEPQAAAENADSELQARLDSLRKT